MIGIPELIAMVLLALWCTAFIDDFFKDTDSVLESSFAAMLACAMGPGAIAGLLWWGGFWA